MNSAQESNDCFEGVALHDRLPMQWKPASLDDGLELEHVNLESARVLQAMAVFEEAPRDASSDADPTAQELHHLEAKIDVLLSLMGGLIAERSNSAAAHSLVLRAGSLEWSGPDSAHCDAGDSGYAMLYLNPSLPLALRLPARIVGSVERGGSRWLLTRFEHLTPAVQTGMEKLVFRRHRRQIALSRGTGVHSETGIFRMSK